MSINHQMLNCCMQVYLDLNLSRKIHFCDLYYNALGIWNGYEIDGTTEIENIIAQSHHKGV